MKNEYNVDESLAEKEFSTQGRSVPEIGANNSRLKKVSKLWGTELWFHEDGGKSYGYTGKILKYNAGYQSSMHYHPKKHETMLINSGEVDIEYKPIGAQAFIKVRLVPGDVIVFPPETPHRLTPVGYCVIFEVSTPHDDSDVVRLEDSKFVGDMRKK